ncbi:MAG: ABC-type transporter, integral membrane subunit [Candidatus Moranbacteria bacterium GW2011_GWF2_35_54]|nr:MAG: ABC-type transporter, integral membrane subunit [Candidatus Moranbacteria bacterium GW2011_GWF2_35_54]
MEIFEYDFILRGIVAGLIIGVVVPLIGIFLVLKRYSLIADTLAHVSLAGVALGLFFGLNPIVTALGSSVVASVAIEKLRNTKKIYGESALALFLSGSLALAVVILSLARGFNANLFSYLFGSIVTVGIKDVYLILILAVITAVVLFIFFKELLYTTFDEDSAKVSGIQTEKINIILIVLTSLAVSLAIPIVGVLLISALIVIPVITALQLKKDFFRTILWAEFFSLFSIMNLNLSTSGTIVLVMLAIFMLVFLFKKYMSHTS